jgi:predicted phage terminase large subunit-like protein
MIAIPKAEAARELFARRRAKERLHDYILFTNPKYKVSLFSELVCSALDQFILDVVRGLRPVLILQAPPQHGKSEIVSRKLPAFLLGKFPDLRIAAASYSDDLALSMAQDVRRNLASYDHRALFPISGEKRKFDVNRMGEFSSPAGTGSYLGVGVGAGLTGRPMDIGIIDDPTKNEQEALSSTTKERHKAWYQSVFTTRLSENSGQIVMATSWAEDDLPAWIAQQFDGDQRLNHLRFPAINSPSETGYNPALPDGALVPSLHSLEKLQETKSLLSDYWWSALYQQSPKSIGGNVFKEIGIHYYLPKDLPEKFDKVLDSWDCTFKDTDGTDYVVGQKWGKRGANCYLLFQVRARMGFVETSSQVEKLAKMRPLPHVILIEDKANGPAVIDFLKKTVPRLFPVEPDGSKLARAHAVTGIWEAGNVFLPDPSIASSYFVTTGRPDKAGTKALTDELTIFNAGANDDQVDALTQALRYLYPFFGRLNISEQALKLAAGLN